MKLTEKEIAELRKLALLKNKHSIHDDYVYIAGERLEFARQEVIPPSVRVMLPRTFLNLPPAIARQTYPSEHRPTVIKTNPSMTVNFAFQHFKEELPMEEVVTCTHYYLATMKKLYPGNEYLENSEHFIDEERTRVLGWYSFRNPALEGHIYNIHAFTNLEDRLLYCTFLTDTRNRFEQWKPFAFEVFDSVTSGREKGGDFL